MRLSKMPNKMPYSHMMHLIFSDFCSISIIGSGYRLCQRFLENAIFCEKMIKIFKNPQNPEKPILTAIIS